MFTLKHISSQGYERIFSVSRAVFWPFDSKNPDSMETHVSCWLGSDDGPSMDFNDGSVYLMNENGKTVSSWHITPIAPR